MKKTKLAIISLLFLIVIFTVAGFILLKYETTNTHPNSVYGQWIYYAHGPALNRVNEKTAATETLAVIEESTPCTISDIEISGHRCYILSEPNFSLHCYDIRSNTLESIKTEGNLTDFHIYQDKLYYLTKITSSTTSLSPGYYIVCCSTDGKFVHAFLLEMDSGWPYFEIAGEHIFYTAEDMQNNKTWLRCVDLDGKNDTALLEIASSQLLLDGDRIVTFIDRSPDSGNVLPSIVPLRLSSKSLVVTDFPFNNGAYFDGEEYSILYGGHLTDGQYYYHTAYDYKLSRASFFVCNANGEALAEIVRENVSGVYWFPGTQGVVVVFYNKGWFDAQLGCGGTDGLVESVWYLEKGNLSRCTCLFQQQKG